MAIELAYYTFEGPFTSLNQISESAGVYCVLCMIANGKIFPVDVGESENIRAAVKDSDKKDCWARNCKGTIAVAVLYTPDQDQRGRDDIVRRVLAWDYLPCTQQDIN